MTTSSMKLSAINPYLLLILWALPIVLSQTINQSLMAHDEGYYAIQARYILETGDWITLQWGAGISFDRTIGIQWLIALCYKFFGVHETSVRLPSMVAYLASMLLTFRIGEIFLGRGIGWLGAIIFSITPIVVQYAGLGTQDMVLVMLELLAAWSLLESRIQGRRSLLFLTGAMFGWGFLIKGFMIIPVTIAFLPALWISGMINPNGVEPAAKSRKIKSRTWLSIDWIAVLWIGLGGIIGLLPAIGWLWAATQQYGWSPLETLVGKVFFLNQHEFHHVDPLYYFWNIPINSFPWSIIGLIGLALCIWNPRYKTPYRWLLLGYPSLLFIELNIFRTKTPYYPLQLLPWIAIWSAVALNHCSEYYLKDLRSQLLGQLSQGIFGLALILLVVGVLLFLKVIPVELDVIRSVATVITILAIGWLIPLILWLTRSSFSQSEFISRWLWSIFLGPWMALTFMGLSGLWGDYAVSLNNGVQSPTVQAILSKETINFIAPPSLDIDPQKDYILFIFKTPHLGQHLTSIEQLPAKSYAWIAPKISTSDRTFATIRGWRLIQHEG
jgi:4-amino-4-deoxy-L-arabinose transferase-like glycosyltransferase